MNSTSVLAGRASVITGAGDGIGRAMARRFAREGASVVIAEFNAAKGQEVADEIVAAGGRALFVNTDVTRKDQVEAAIAACVEGFGSVDILVNNAYSGGGGLSRLEKKTDGEFEYAFLVNFWACRWSMSAALPHMKARRWGRIINVGSLNGVNAHMGTAEYNVSKEALRTLTRSAAREWAEHQICCNIICPAAVTSAFQKFKAMAPEVAAAAEQANPMHRMGDPDTDIAGVALFLASEDSRYVTGNTLYADGGSHINGATWAPQFED